MKNTAAVARPIRFLIVEEHRLHCNYFPIFCNLCSHSVSSVRTLYYLCVRVHCPSVVFTKLTQCAHVYTYAEAMVHRSNIVPSYVKTELTIKVNLLNEYKNIIILNADSRNCLYICRGNIATQLKFIIICSYKLRFLVALMPCLMITRFLNGLLMFMMI